MTIRATMLAKISKAGSDFWSQARIARSRWSGPRRHKMFPTLCQVEFLSRPSNETKFEKIVLSDNHNDSDARKRNRVVDREDKL